MVADVLEKLTLLLGPFAPYMAEEMWEHDGPDRAGIQAAWPAVR